MMFSDTYDTLIAIGLLFILFFVSEALAMLPKKYIKANSISQLILHVIQKMAEALLVRKIAG